MDAKQFAWLYLIENGYAGCKHDFYGGWEIVDETAKEIYSNNLVIDICKINQQYLLDIKKYGVDWGKSKEPQSDIAYLFDSTFTDAKRVEIITGKLVLKNGTVQSWAANNIEVSNVFEIMANVDAAKERFKQMVGD